jgi:hypothetical protein
VIGLRVLEVINLAEVVVVTEVVVVVVVVVVVTVVGVMVVEVVEVGVVEIEVVRIGVVVVGAGVVVVVVVELVERDFSQQTGRIAKFPSRSLKTRSCLGVPHGAQATFSPRNHAHGMWAGHGVKVVGVVVVEVVGIGVVVVGAGVVVVVVVGLVDPAIKYIQCTTRMFRTHNNFTLTIPRNTVVLSPGRVRAERAYYHVPISVLEDTVLPGSTPSRASDLFSTPPRIRNMLWPPCRRHIGSCSHVWYYH